MRTRFVSFLAALTAASVASCAVVSDAVLDRSLPAVPLPARGTVDRAEVTLPSHDPFHPTPVGVTDPARVERLLAFLAARNSGWYGTWHTGAAAALKVCLKRGGETVLVLDIGESWVSALACGPNDSYPTRYRDLSEKDRAELLAIFDLPADTPSNR